MSLPTLRKGADDDVTDAMSATAAGTSSVSAAVQRSHETMAVFVLEQRVLVSVTPERVLKVRGIVPCAELLGPGSVTTPLGPAMPATPIADVLGLAWAEHPASDRATVS